MNHDTLQLETPRLILRVPRAEDFDAWAAFKADEEANRYIGGTEPRALGWRGEAAMEGAWSIRGCAMY